jgi:hypothetical protein
MRRASLLQLGTEVDHTSQSLLQLGKPVSNVVNCQTLTSKLPGSLFTTFSLQRAEIKLT